MPYDGAAEPFSKISVNKKVDDYQRMHHIMGGPVYWESAAKGPVVYVSTESNVINAFGWDRATARRLAAQVYALLCRPEGATARTIAVTG